MLYISNLPNNISAAATKGPKENLRTYQRKSRYERRPVLIKLVTLFNYWTNHMEKLIAVANPIQNLAKSPRTSFSHVASTNVGISPPKLSDF